ncbi:zinc-ribbon domain-containing protein [Candidatus Viridilinea mediisalina]|uniref:Zinc-ribbon domain-containing protein n=1 Tax=Candidatus Viridilinea mediisalina TaxID=2024553 RepID=A0A2A6RDC8_9CHLR|nr:zinc-ribbon domain-containing protein [Candidatus Viridilinea mediisalina]PDV99620.1 hypothetical protein CJ255_21420 [Candidatus Viridilinea mediisalina]
MSDITCPNCGKKTSETTYFCPECGARLNEAREATGSQATVVLPPYAAPATQRFDEPTAAEAASHDAQWATTQAFPTPNPSEAVSGSQNNRAIWWLFATGGCLLIAFLGTCIAAFAALLAFQPDGPIQVEEVSGIAPTQGAGGGGIVPLDAPIAGGAILLRESFDQPANSVVSSSESQYTRYAFEDGAYVIEVKATERIAWAIVGGPYDDVRITLDTRMRASDPAAAIGIIFNHQDDNNFYLYSISNDGYYMLEILINDQWDALIDWTASNHINTTSNRMGVATRGEQISLYVNDMLLTQTRDATFRGGDVGIALASFDEVPARVSFDNLVITRN